MYTLKNINDSKWMINGKLGFSFMGTFKEVMEICIGDLEFNPDELEVAVTEMVHADHNTASFGINRTFMFTSNKLEDNKDLT